MVFGPHCSWSTRLGTDKIEGEATSAKGTLWPAAVGRNRGSGLRQLVWRSRRAEGSHSPQIHRDEEARKSHKVGRSGRGKLTSVCLTSQDFKSCSYLPNPCSPTILQPPHCFNLALLTSKHICSQQRAGQTLSQASCSLLPKPLSPSAGVSLSLADSHTPSPLPSLRYRTFFFFHG